jgi:hypothetical protein
MVNVQMVSVQKKIERKERTRNLLHENNFEARILCDKAILFSYYECYENTNSHLQFMNIHQLFSGVCIE